jgi:hypothetical protein
LLKLLSYQPARMNKITFRIVVACAGLLGLLAITSHLRSRSRIRELEQELQRRVESRAALPEADGGAFKPSPNATTQARNLGQSLPAASDQLSKSNIFARLQRETKPLTIAQVEAYLKTAGRTAPNLLAAFRTSGDTGLLREAMEKYPSDPLVAFEASFSRRGARAVAQCA